MGGAVAPARSSQELYHLTPGGLASPASHSTADARCREGFDLSFRSPPSARERVHPGHCNDRRRSFRLADLAPLADVPGVSLVSLRRGFGTDQVADVGFPIVDPGLAGIGRSGRSGRAACRTGRIGHRVQVRDYSLCPVFASRGTVLRSARSLLRKKSEIVAPGTPSIVEKKAQRSPEENRPGRLTRPGRFARLGRHQDPGPATAEPPGPMRPRRTWSSPT